MLRETRKNRLYEKRMEEENSTMGIRDGPGEK